MKSTSYLFDAILMQSQTDESKESGFSTFISNFENILKRLFHEESNISRLSQERGFPEDIRRQIMDCNPLSVAIPTEFGGRGCHVQECLGVLSAASYESLPLSLTFGINIALFLEPLAKYGNPEIQTSIFKGFLEKQQMGGLMITEPDFGSDALNMRTSYLEKENSFDITGTKHWQGLTGMADYWIITARKENEKGDLGRDIDFFVCDTSKNDQKVLVEEVFDNPGLYMIPYGRNVLDLKIPKNQKLQVQSTGIKLMLDVLHRSRLQFPGMGMGFIKRMLDDAMKHCRQRIVGKSNLLALDQVQFQLSRIQAAYTITSAMCTRSVKISGIDHDLASEGFEANSMKAVVTDIMYEAADHLVQLSGARGYRQSHVGGRGIMDSRPFRIFEGSNEMLYSQIAEMIMRTMKGAKVRNLLDYLKVNPVTHKAVEFFRKDLDFEVEKINVQRKMVDLGRILGRVVCAGYVLELGEKGFNKQLVDNCITHIRQEVSAMVSNLNFSNLATAIDTYEDNSAWWKFST